MLDSREKVWGWTSRIFATDSVEVHRIECVKGGYCSEHSHRSKSNLFYCERGSLTVKIWRGNNLSITTLTPGLSCAIPPGLKHQFESNEDGTVAYEIYHVIIDPDDIQRESQGGIRMNDN